MLSAADHEIDYEGRTNTLLMMAVSKCIMKDTFTIGDLHTLSSIGYLAIVVVLSPEY